MRMPGFSADASLYNRGGQYEHLYTQKDRIDGMTVVTASETGTTPSPTVTVIGSKTDTTSLLPLKSTCKTYRLCALLNDKDTCSTFTVCPTHFPLVSQGV